MRTNNLELNVIIPNFNGKKLLINCLESIANQTYENYYHCIG